jgi:hypothetical protein
MRHLTEDCQRVPKNRSMVTENLVCAYVGSSSGGGGGDCDLMVYGTIQYLQP